ncbi:hypothetical protein ES677_04850 [Bizionia gelidisalsuginis]|uniref:Beta-carotene 15,15'-monooxygenase n=2 Tax=Bizionia TaxID=283785 RepID=A0A8H2LM49_9FLAO|nr:MULTISPECIES: DUF6427 family protein [Bizionia]TYB74212.1 hypothetical protein ES676_08500 [Bizionia saleffrena]TYC15674.1 hypothetical protein ES677_04850 [Bizionia gelidisalsuginis]
MITSFFSKSKPINFLIVFLISFIALLTAVFKYESGAFTLERIVKLGLVFGVSYVSILVVDFIVTKNSLTGKSNYEILLYSLFLLLVPQVFTNQEVLFSNLLILLAIRRIVSIRTQKEVIKKLFDAGFLVALASLIYFWAALFFIVILLALFFFSEQRLKNWLVPFVGFSAVIVVAITASVVFNDTLYGYLTLAPQVDFDLSHYNSIQFMVAITVLLSFGLWSSIFYLKDLNTKTGTFKPAYKVVFVSCLVAAAILIIAPNKDGSEFVFLFAPLSVVITNYIETIADKLFKDLFVIVLFIIPFLLLVL